MKKRTLDDLHFRICYISLLEDVRENKMPYVSIYYVQQLVLQSNGLFLFYFIFYVSRLWVGIHVQLNTVIEKIVHGKGWNSPNLKDLEFSTIHRQNYNSVDCLYQFLSGDMITARPLLYLLLFMLNFMYSLSDQSSCFIKVPIRDFMYM